MRKPSSTKPPPDHVFFTDRDLGRIIIPGALEAAGVRVERHDTHFRPHTPDPEWLHFVGERGWIALSHNRHIRYRADERDMVMRAGVPLFLLIGDATHVELADNLVLTLPLMLKFLQSQRPPFIAKIYRPSPTGLTGQKPGSVRLALSLAEWQGMQRRKE